MKLEAILKNDFILCQHHFDNKKSLLEYISIIFTQNMSPKIKDLIFDAFLERENLGTTALGYGVAIPHIRTDIFETPQLAIIQLKTPIEFGAEDRQPVDIIFALIASNSHHNEHLELLAECSKLLIQPELRQKLRNSMTISNIISTIKQMNDHAEVI